RRPAGRAGQGAAAGVDAAVSSTGSGLGKGREHTRNWHNRGQRPLRDMRRGGTVFMGGGRVRGPRHDIWRFALFFGFLLALFAVPHASAWFGLVLLVPVLAALAVAASMLRVAIRRRRAARVLARQHPLRPLHG